MSLEAYQILSSYIYNIGLYNIYNQGFLYLGVYNPICSKILMKSIILFHLNCVLFVKLPPQKTPARFMPSSVQPKFTIPLDLSWLLAWIFEKLRVTTIKVFNNIAKIRWPFWKLFFTIWSISNNFSYKIVSKDPRILCLIGLLCHISIH